MYLDSISSLSIAIGNKLKFDKEIDAFIPDNQNKMN